MRLNLGLNTLNQLGCHKFVNTRNLLLTIQISLKPRILTIRVLDDREVPQTDLALLLSLSMWRRSARRSEVKNHKIWIKSQTLEYLRQTSSRAGLTCFWEKTCLTKVSAGLEKVSSEVCIKSSIVRTLDLCLTEV
jgi:hypothetical protein